MKRITLAVAVTLAISASAFGQVQQCPNTDPEFCWTQYSTCYSDNEGKNCSWQTCQAYCDNEYDECMYGMKGSIWWENPVISRTVDTSVNEGDDIGCILGCTAWACTCMYNWIPYRRYHTDWQRVQKQNRSCPGYSYVDVLQVINQYDDLCYQHDNDCSPLWEEDQECMSQSPCVFNQDGTQIVIP